MQAVALSPAFENADGSLGEFLLKKNRRDILISNIKKMVLSEKAKISKDLYADLVFDAGEPDFTPTAAEIMASNIEWYPCNTKDTEHNISEQLLKLVAVIEKTQTGTRAPASNLIEVN